jgi:hypothetical protein
VLWVSFAVGLYFEEHPVGFSPGSPVPTGQGISRRRTIASLAAIAGIATVSSLLAQGLRSSSANSPVPTAAPKASPANDLTWTHYRLIRGTASDWPPALAVWNDTLYMAFVVNNYTNDILMISSKRVNANFQLVKSVSISW